MKTQFVKFRITLYEKKLLKVKAKKAGLTLSEYCRRVTQDIEIVERLTEEQITLYKMLVQFHNNFKSIGNLFRKKDPSLTTKVNELADEIKKHLNNFNT